MCNLIWLGLCAGSGLDVCGMDLQNEQQCCAQADEDYFGMTLNNAIRYNVSLGSEVIALQMLDLNAALTCKSYSTGLIDSAHYVGYVVSN